MSKWIRIDDDTYIDDSLVTCAEYQLFIDEMRTQGKYHQPDHWTEYHFPKDHARQPILGIRSSDAVAFYEWLTKRDNDNWIYRLPDQQEVQEYPIRKSYLPSVGYWTVGEIEKKFVCGGVNRENVDVLDIDKLNNLEINKSLALSFVQLLVGRNFEFIHIMASALIVQSIDSINISIDRIGLFSKNRDNAIRNEVAKEIILDRAVTALSLDKKICTVDTLIRLEKMITTIQARMDGTSPAFEGIRLVRERIK